MLAVAKSASTYSRDDRLVRGAVFWRARSSLSSLAMGVMAANKIETINSQRKRNSSHRGYITCDILHFSLENVFPLQLENLPIVRWRHRRKQNRRCDREIMRCLIHPEGRQIINVVASFTDKF